MTPYYSDECVTLYLGDMRDIVPSLPLADVALVLTDPPYGDTSLGWDTWPKGWLEALPTTVRQMWCFGSMRMFLEHGNEFAAWRYGQEVVWEKHNGSGFASDRFKRVHEFAMHWYCGPWAGIEVHPQFTDDATKRAVRRKERPPHTGAIAGSTYTSVDGGPRLQRSVQFVRSMHGTAIHPTEKPLGILEPLIRYSTNPGDVILDPFGGSCSTARAARANGRRAICIEANEEYLERAVLALHQGVLAF